MRVMIDIHLVYRTTKPSYQVRGIQQVRGEIAFRSTLHAIAFLKTWQTQSTKA